MKSSAVAKPRHFATRLRKAGSPGEREFRNVKLDVRVGGSWGGANQVVLTRFGKSIIHEKQTVTVRNLATVVDSAAAAEIVVTLFGKPGQRK
jgi:hypothetical protein